MVEHSSLDASPVQSSCLNQTHLLTYNEMTGPSFWAFPLLFSLHQMGHLSSSASAISQSHHILIIPLTFLF